MTTRTRAGTATKSPAFAAIQSRCPGQCSGTVANPTLVGTGPANLSKGEKHLERIHAPQFPGLSGGRRALQRASWRAFLEKHLFVVPMKTGYDWESPMYQVPYGPDFERHWALLDHLVGMMAEDAARQGARLTLVWCLQPFKFIRTCGPTSKTANPAAPGKRLDSEAPTQRLIEIGRKHRLR